MDRARRLSRGDDQHITIAGKFKAVAGCGRSILRRGCDMGTDAVRESGHCYYQWRTHDHPDG